MWACIEGGDYQILRYLRAVLLPIFQYHLSYLTIDASKDLLANDIRREGVDDFMNFTSEVRNVLFPLIIIIVLGYLIFRLSS